jgi:hypothetical protein
MQEPSLSSSRLAIAGSFIAAILLAGGGFLIGRATLPVAETMEPKQVSQPTAPPTPAVETLGVFSRTDIIAIGRGAADALASGLPLPPEATDVAGRRFDLVLPFGCDGSASPDSAVPMRWSYDAEQQTLRIHVAPTQWESGGWGLSQADGKARGMAGFWVSHPWTTAERCPHSTDVSVPESQPATVPEQTLAIAQLLPDGADGERPKGRPYAIVKRMPRESFAPEQGFRLRLAGRIDRFPNGQSVQCVQPLGIEQRPTCLVAISFDEVRIENPLDGEVLGTWSMNPAKRNAP